jgi:hypothetical protein
LLTEDACHEKLKWVLATKQYYRPSTTYCFFKGSVLEHPPHTSVDPEVFPKVEERLQRHPGCVQRTFNVAWHTLSRVFIGLYRHDAVPEVASKEQVLS